MAEQNSYDKDLSLDEIVFENRNKEYGAYDLRHNYKRILTKSFIIGVGLFLLAALSPLIYLTVKNLTKPPKTEVKADLVNVIQEDKIIEKPEEQAPPPPPPPPKEEPKQEIIQNVVPEPKIAPKVETPPPPITKQLETTTGLINQEGEKKAAYTAPVAPQAPAGNGNAPTPTAPKAPAPDNSIHEGNVDSEAEFSNGGINGFRTKVSENFDTSAMNGDEGTLKTEVTFVVEKDGSISQVKATGSNSDFNREAERTVKSIHAKWTPAKVDGQPVRSRFRLPLTMNFE